MNNSVNPVPEGFHTATPYLIVNDAGAAMNFYEAAFGAITTERLTNPAGEVNHGEMRIGTSMIMIGGHKNIASAGDGLPAVSIYLYVGNAVEVAKTAIAAGATELNPVAERPYGNREGGIRDPFGITWWIASRIEVLTEAEIQKRQTARA